MLSGTSQARSSSSEALAECDSFLRMGFTFFCGFARDLTAASPAACDDQAEKS